MQPYANEMVAPDNTQLLRVYKESAGSPERWSRLPVPSSLWMPKAAVSIHGVRAEGNARRADSEEASGQCDETLPKLPEISPSRPHEGALPQAQHLTGPSSDPSIEVAAVHLRTLNVPDHSAAPHPSNPAGRWSYLSSDNRQSASGPHPPADPSTPMRTPRRLRSLQVQLDAAESSSIERATEESERCAQSAAMVLAELPSPRPNDWREDCFVQQLLEEEDMQQQGVPGQSGSTGRQPCKRWKENLPGNSQKSTVSGKSKAIRPELPLSARDAGAVSMERLAQKNKLLQSRVTPAFGERMPKSDQIFIYKDRSAHRRKGWVHHKVLVPMKGDGNVAKQVGMSFYSSKPGHGYNFWEQCRNHGVALHPANLHRPPADPDALPLPTSQTARAHTSDSASKSKCSVFSLYERRVSEGETEIKKMRTFLPCRDNRVLSNADAVQPHPPTPAKGSLWGEQHMHVVTQQLIDDVLWDCGYC
ncbi:hypothetical protein CYMTET_22954 [Cymbomonas tetramitiformis]|uniref:Uncharacterized protein n=1 Tax=Cymbomonas tetramitiformis TaxID=36881 RepID=A0AAE0L1P7_9CHLO|nr:hypothetical protein CYMTET_22954 [Cymbomonas tetramitiformis]